MNSTRSALRRTSLIAAAAIFGLVQMSAAGAAAAPGMTKDRLSAIVSSDGSKAGMASSIAATTMTAGKGAGIPADFNGTAKAPDAQGIGVNSIIPPDERYPVNPGAYPGTSTVLITFSGGRCSGWMAGYNPANLTSTIVTAGHCVHTGGSGGAWRTGVAVYPGYPSTGFGCSAITLYSVVGWTTNGSADYDYGAIKVNCAPSGQPLAYWTGWYGFFWTTASLIGLFVVTQGYPGDKPITEQWGSNGNVQAESLRLFYNNDTVGGQSGSTVYNPNRAGCGHCTAAIHAYGGSLNSGVRITQPVFNNLVAWINA